MFMFHLLQLSCEAKQRISISFFGAIKCLQDEVAYNLFQTSLKIDRHQRPGRQAYVNMTVVITVLFGFFIFKQFIESDIIKYIRSTKCILFSCFSLLNSSISHQVQSATQTIYQMILFNHLFLNRFFFFLSCMIGSSLCIRSCHISLFDMATFSAYMLTQHAVIITLLFIAFFSHYLIFH